MPLAPIWKDRRVTLATSGDYADFEIRLDNTSGTLLYSGRAYPRPGETDITAKINDICAPYIRTTAPSLYQRFTAMLVSQTFATCVSGVAKDTITFYNDWSYDRDYAANINNPLSDPITGELDPRQTLMFSVLSGVTSVNVTLNFTDGTSLVVAVQVAISADFNNDFNNDYAQNNDPNRSGTAILDLSAYTGLASVTFMGVTLPVRQDPCGIYCVYYVNAYGGWDSYLLDGYTSRRDALTRYSANTEYDNADETARGRKDYAIEVAPEWTLRTGILTDDQSGRMHHLLNSPEVYLQDLTDGHFFPVVLTDTEAARKDYKGNGRQLNTYTFTARYAQDMTRR